MVWQLPTSCFVCQNFSDSCFALRHEKHSTRLDFNLGRTHTTPYYQAHFDTMDFSFLSLFLSKNIYNNFISFYLYLPLLFKSCERKNIYRNSKGRRNGRKPLSHKGFFLSFAIYFPKEHLRTIYDHFFLTLSFFLSAETL